MARTAMDQKKVQIISFSVLLSRLLNKATNLTALSDMRDLGTPPLARPMSLNESPGSSRFSLAVDSGILCEASAFLSLRSSRVSWFPAFLGSFKHGTMQD